MQNIKSNVIVSVLISVLVLSTIQAFLTTSAALPYTEITGTLNGANYLIRIPNPVETWNRNLVVYCHGYSHTEPQPPLNAATGGADAFIASGTAFAMSSYGMGGYFIQTAINNTYLLTQYVKTTYNVTGKIFLFGISQGGGVSLQLAEKYPNLYSGVLDISGSKDLKISYSTRIDQLSAKNDTELAAKLQALGASVPPYPFPTLASLHSFNTNQRDDMENATGGTPDTVPKAYEDVSASYHANISIPVITVHALGDPVNTYAQALTYQSAVAAAGKSSFYRLYSTNGTGHVDSTVTSQIPTRFAELASWSSTLQDWDMTVSGRSMKSYPDLKEYAWQKNVTMSPNGQYDKIGLHRLVKAGTTPKGVVFLTNCPTWGMGEAQLSNTANDTFTKYESYNQAIYWANRDFDVYAIDFRTHFAPKPLNASVASYAANWGLDVWVSDIKEAAEKIKEISGISKFFISGECSGGEAALNYAAKYWRTDLKGIILLDPTYQGVTGHPIVARMNGTNTYNLTYGIESLSIANNWTKEDFPQVFKDISLYALQNPGAPAQYPPGTPLTPIINPLTNRTWTNMTEWYTYLAYINFGNLPTTPGIYANTMGGYTNISQLQYAVANSEFLPWRLLLENQAMSDWVTCPYLAYDYDDHYSEIGVPTLVFGAELSMNRTGTFRFVNGINNTDFTGVMLKSYGHTDVFFGTYSARDVSQPALDWMVNHTLAASASSSSASVQVGQSVTFSVSVSGGPAPYTYQWYEGTAALAGQTAAQLTTTKITPGTYTYYCKVTDSMGMATNSTITTLAVTAAPTPTPTPTATPVPTAAPTSTAAPTATHKPTQTPTATPSLIPTTTLPTATVQPTSTPSSGGSTLIPDTTLAIVAAVLVIIVVVVVAVVILGKRRK